MLSDDNVADVGVYMYVNDIVLENTWAKSLASVLRVPVPWAQEVLPHARPLTIPLALLVTSGFHSPLIL